MNPTHCEHVDEGRVTPVRVILAVILVLVAKPPAGLAAPRTVATPAVLERILAGQPPRNTADLKAMQSRIEQVAKESTACTVGVIVGVSHGSGVIVSADGYVLTAAHVVGRPGRRAQVVLSDGRIFRGKSLGMQVQADVGLLKIVEKGTWPYAKMGTSDNLHAGQWCLATGYPGGYEEGRLPALRIGRITAAWKSTIRTDCVLTLGDSGGPLFDLAGNVIGIHSRVGIPVAMNLHIPVDAYRDRWDRLVAGRLWGVTSQPGPYIGVVRDPESSEAAILQVRRNSPAEEAGLKPGDVIVQFGKKKVHTFGDLVDLVRASQPGEEVTIRIRRGQQSLDMPVRIGGNDESS